MTERTIRGYSPKNRSQRSSSWDDLRAESPAQAPPSMRQQMQDSITGAFSGLPIQLAVDAAGIPGTDADAWLGLSAASVEPFATWDRLLHQAGADFVLRGMYARDGRTARMFGKKGVSLDRRLRAREGVLKAARILRDEPLQVHLKQAERARSEGVRPQDLRKPTLGDLNPEWESRQLANSRPAWAPDGVEILPHTAFEG